MELNKHSINICWINRNENAETIHGVAFPLIGLNLLVSFCAEQSWYPGFASFITLWYTYKFPSFPQCPVRKWRRVEKSAIGKWAIYYSWLWHKEGEAQGKMKDHWAWQQVWSGHIQLRIIERFWLEKARAEAAIESSVEEGSRAH